MTIKEEILRTFGEITKNGTDSYLEWPTDEMILEFADRIATRTRAEDIAMASFMAAAIWEVNDWAEDVAIPTGELEKSIVAAIRSPKAGSVEK
jgi:hypothetical protein